MFTGIIEELGRVKNIRRSGAILRLQIQADQVAEGLKIGDSLSVNGACLTLVSAKGKLLDFDVIQETSQKTTLGKLRIGEEVNLERALKAGERISGHFVNGHVDCVGIVLGKDYKNNNIGLVIRFPTQYSKLVVEKGSIAVDGISLTIAQVRNSSFTVYIIPHTLENTTLKFKNPSSLVNLEFDILLKSHR